ncbi:MAG: acyl-CoA dehydrogenase [Myxococcales bacterium]|nr:acyl-CoA dehydrogenase [Myxococcales bacterium]
MALGGYGAPPSVYWAVFELLVGANPAATFYLLGEVNAHVINRLGTPKQQEVFARGIIERKWGGTMMLTEPGAGSDVGSCLSRAKHVEGDLWHLEGTKRFITNGDFDTVENIIHLVLARREGGPGGTRGLSMFIVPKYLINEDGSLGERNGVFATGLEKKMGLTASSTCEMTLGEHRPCVGYLVGDEHRGMPQMFQVIEHARMGVGFKSFSTLSSAYLQALEYAKERVQGPDLAQAMDRAAPRVPIIQHPDVRRMLMTQKAFAEGMRALGMYAASIQDQVTLAGGHGHPDAQALDRLNDLLLPLIKGYCSEKVYSLLGSHSLQCFGGSGYLKDYPIEQYVRDQKIDTLYEGTTHIQALDLLFRKVAKDGGATLQGLLQQMEATASSEAGGEACHAAKQRLSRGIADVQGMFMAAMQKMGASIYHVGLQGNRILFSLAELTIGWLLIRQAEVAAECLSKAPDQDRAFYEGKLATAAFYSAEVLPGLTLARKQVEGSSLAVMELANESF